MKSNEILHKTVASQQVQVNLIINHEVKDMLQYYCNHNPKSKKVPYQGYFRIDLKCTY